MSRRLKIGIAYEGSRDLPVITILIKRILCAVDVEVQIVKAFQARSGIIKYVAAYTRSFFEDAEVVDIAFFVTDQDFSEDPRKEKIIQIIQKINPAYILRSVVALPNPHLEKWLLADQDVVKAVFKLPGDKPLPGNHLNPKDQLEYIRSSVGGSQLAGYEVYEILAKRFDMNKVVLVCSEFESFKNRTLEITLS